VLLHTVGAKSGLPRTTPVVYRADGDRLIVFASKAGAPDDPAWFHNIVADPNLTIEYRTDTGVARSAARSEELKGEERDRLYAAQAADAPQFKEYEEKTDRTIPVVALYPEG
jgi:deazaflavin-dependent oxidoreductase (nitroreductase family)